MAIENAELIKHLAERNRRGMTVSDLVCELQQARDEAENAETAEEVFYWQCVVSGILKEVRRRRNINYDLSQAPDKEIIETIKSRVQVADILERYTEVMTDRAYSHRTQLKYRCPAHSDNHPSGVIYVTENRFHCYQCGRHGDVIDVLTAYGGMDTGKAIAELARDIGIDTKPIIPTSNEKWLKSNGKL